MNPQYAALVRDRVTAAQPVYAQIQPDAPETLAAANDDANDEASAVQRLI